jgi:hypothetical protein
MFEKVENECKTVHAIELPTPRAATCRVLIGEVISSGSTSVQGDERNPEQSSFNHFLLENSVGG